MKNIQEEFIAKVKSMKMFDGKLEYSRTFKWEDSENDKATIFLSSIAFAKMNALIQQFDSEVAWHGVVHRDEEDPTIFRITDILVYPQVVSGATVNTDQEAYQTWLYAFDDDVFNNIRMQGIVTSTWACPPPAWTPRIRRKSWVRSGMTTTTSS